MTVTNNKGFLSNLRIDLSELVGEECFIEVSDMSIFQTLRFKENADSELKQYEVLREVLPEIIVDHNLFKEDGSKMNGEEVTEWLLGSRWDLASMTYQSILNYMFRSPILRRTE